MSVQYLLGSAQLADDARTLQVLDGGSRGLELAGANSSTANVTVSGPGSTLTCWRRPKTEPLLRVVPTEN